MKVNQVVSGVLLGASLLASSAAMAGKLNGNIGVVSDYMFRGLDQSGNSGAAVQGGVDYEFDFGLYTGLWVSNAALAGGNEADAYVGYGLKLGEFNLDGGVIYYAYTEDTEGPPGPGAKNLDYAELYVGGSIGPAAVKVFYAPEFRRDFGGPNRQPDDELLYVTASVTLTLTDSISFIPQVGFSAGDGAKGAFGDEYTDYSLTAIKKLKDEMSVSLAVIGTDLDNYTGGVGSTPGSSDNPKFVIGFKKNFKLM